MESGEILGVAAGTITHSRGYRRKRRESRCCLGARHSAPTPGRCAIHIPANCRTRDKSPRRGRRFFRRRGHLADARLRLIFTRLRLPLFFRPRARTRRFGEAGARQPSNYERALGPISGERTAREDSWRKLRIGLYKYGGW